MSHKIRVIQTREFVYSPNLNDDEFYEECSNLQQAIEADKKWIDERKGTYEDLSDDPSTSKVIWQIYDDETGEVIQEV